MTEKEILTEISRLEIKSEALGQRNYHKEMYSDPYSREIRRLLLTLDFVRLGFKTERHQQGLVVGDFIIAWNKNKWRKKGKDVWYYYSKPSDFLSKYT